MTAPLETFSLRRAYLLLKALPADAAAEVVAAAWADCAARLGCAPSVLQSRLVTDYEDRAPRMPAALAVAKPKRRAPSRRRGSPRPWTAEEDALIRAAFATAPVKLARIARQMGRERASVRAHARKLGLNAPPKRPQAPVTTQEARRLARGLPRYRGAWTAEEDAILREVWTSGAPFLMATASVRLGRSLCAVKTRARKIGVVAPQGRPWTEEEDTIIRRLWADPVAKGVRLASAVGATGRTRAAVMDRAKKIGAFRAPPRPSGCDEWPALIASGLTVGEVAQANGVHPRTVKRYLSMPQSRGAGAAHSIQGRAAPDPLEML